MSELNGVQLRIKGKVQGVGFRPFVWQLAHQLQLCGDVCNDSEGVLVRLLNHVAITNFIEQLHQQCPPLAFIESIHAVSYDWQRLPEGFTIRLSQTSEMDTQIVADAATCPQCVADTLSSNNRRYLYPFTNCTHCGPRFTIIQKIPYDRSNTTMAKFTLCKNCQSEYDSPANRRFHAQPNACPQCGPHISLLTAEQHQIASHDNALNIAAQQLLAGQILAIKGLGGFHLACDATNSQAVDCLRQRKKRPDKPFAVMIPSIDWLYTCDINLIKLLQSQAAPIVLIEKASCPPLSGLIAPGLNEIGIMLPSTPLHHLLMRLVNRPLVMTSGNARGKPPAITNQQALQQLNSIADLFLLHNRDIIQRADDSVLRCHQQQIETLRRARGYVPDAQRLPADLDHDTTILALGADLKNTFCLLRGRNAVVSQHIGDLNDIDIIEQWKQLHQHFQHIYQATPNVIAADAHTGYFSHQYGKTLAAQLDIPFIPVFHHHAHVATVLAEHCWLPEQGKVIGLVLDGLGMGPDNQLWGGECLLADYSQCFRFGGLPAVALPGGDLAATQPWRNLLAHGLTFVPHWETRPEAAVIPAKYRHPITQAILRGLNSPLASSCGRLFDAVAAALNICAERISWEGQAAYRLQAVAQQSKQTTFPVTMPLNGQTLDLAIFWKQWLNYQAEDCDKAMAFHVALATGLAKLVHKAAQQYNINTVVLSGGVLHNTLLRSLLLSELGQFKVLYSHQFPMGDGGISLGQAMIVRQIMQQSSTECESTHIV